jgi:hypothetical protein
MLKVVKNDTPTRAWCGPTVVSCITGKKVSKVREAIRKVRGPRSDGTKAAIMGTTTYEVRSAFAALGWRMDRVKSDKIAGLTLAAWLRQREKGDLSTYVVEVTGHWVAVRGRMFVDTFTKGEPVTIGKAPGRRKRVVAVYRVTKVVP